MTDSMRVAIETADVDGLRAQLTADPSLADTDVRCGDRLENVLPPLHVVCDAVFRNLLTQDQALDMADLLLDAGVDPERSYAKSGDTFLIAAASLGAERVGTRLVQLGVDVTPRGLFGATALHWAAHMGLDGLARVLVERGAELELADTRYGCTPLQWALHAWCEGTNGRREGLPAVASVLVQAGARVPANALGELTNDSDGEMRQALGTSPPR